MKFILLLVFIGTISLSARANNLLDSTLSVLDKELNNENVYLSAKLERIAALKNQLNDNKLDLESKYDLYNSIFEEYKSFNYDSAFSYIKLVHSISYQLKSKEKVTAAKIKLGFIFLSSGMFKEAFDSLGTLEPKKMQLKNRIEYYSVMAILYFGLSDLKDRFYAPMYEVKAYLYVDSVLSESPENSYNYLYYKGLRHIRKLEFDEGLAALQLLRSKDSLSLHEIAIISSTMSDIFINKSDNDRAIALLVEASVCDIKDATKETAAILNLANILYKQGDIKRAYAYTKRALEDANFYGARHRKIQVGSILPIIEEEKINTVEKQKQMLLSYSIAVTILSLIVALFIIIILRQLKKIKKADTEILGKNKELLKTNQKLIEANKIKDVYIGYYFNINSNYIDKLENLKTSIEKNLENNKFDNVRYIVNRIDLKKERTALFQGFDRAFLNLFPNFVDEFNAMFEEKDQIKLSVNELLNTDLRIFALIRLGITENDKIAKILEFSVNTIYTYKTKIKNKSIVPNEEFEKRIMKIKFA